MYRKKLSLRQIELKLPSNNYSPKCIKFPKIIKKILSPKKELSSTPSGSGFTPKKEHNIPKRKSLKFPKIK